MYTNLSSVKLSLGIPLNDTLEDAVLSQYITMSTDIINEWIGRDLNKQTITEYYKGNGGQLLPLNQRPVILVKQTCTLNGTTSVTVADGAKLSKGMPVCGTNPTPVNNPSAPAIVPGTTISAISGNTVTLSQAANATGSQTLFFGLSVWVDEGAFWGQTAGGFASGTALTPGADFALDVDQSDGSSRSGLLYAINFYWPEPFNYCPGLITPVLGPAEGNIKVTYTFGYDPVPPSVQLAANWIVARIRQVSPMGQAMQSESVKDYSYSLANAGEGIGIITPEIGALLAKYINVAV